MLLCGGVSKIWSTRVQNQNPVQVVYQTAGQEAGDKDGDGGSSGGTGPSGSGGMGLTGTEFLGPSNGWGPQANSACVTKTPTPTGLVMTTRCFSIFLYKSKKRLRDKRGLLKETKQPKVISISHNTIRKLKSTRTQTIPLETR